MPLLLRRSRGWTGIPRLLLLLLCSGACSASLAPVVASRQREGALELPGERRLRYLLYRPVEYEDDRGPWPLILFLHGDGERGNDLSSVKREGLPRILEGLLHFPFLVLSPQCAKRQHWSVQTLDRLLQEVSAKERVDPGRIFATGLSGGGNAALELAARFPDRFAAVAAVSVNRAPEEICRLKAVPLWIFHNAGDERIPVRTSEKLVRRLRQCGAEVRFTVYERDGHDAWSETYVRSDLYAWFQDRARAAGS